MTSVDYAEWFADAQFTKDWTSHHFSTWMAIFSERRTMIRDVLEIGSWEGRSAIFFLNYFPKCKIVCIDTFRGSSEYIHPEFLEPNGQIEQRFDVNLARYSERVEKIKAQSIDGLPNLALSGQRYDLVYVDGSHRAIDVYADAALAWPMVRLGGVLVFDDYTWTMMPNETDRPKLGIDTFLTVMRGSYREIHRNLQVMIERI